MTPEQMREAAAKIASDVGGSYCRDPDGVICRHVAGRIRQRILDIPLTPPEDTMLERLTWAPVPPGQSRRDHARKILGTMREPTEAMVMAGASIARYPGDIREIYHAMIDAAIA